MNFFFLRGPPPYPTWNQARLRLFLFSYFFIFLNDIPGSRSSSLKCRKLKHVSSLKKKKQPRSTRRAEEWSVDLK